MYVLTFKVKVNMVTYFFDLNLKKYKKQLHYTGFAPGGLIKY